MGWRRCSWGLNTIGAGVSRRAMRPAELPAFSSGILDGLSCDGKSYTSRQTVQIPATGAFEGRTRKEAPYACWVSDMPVSDRMTLEDWRQFGTGLVGLQAVGARQFAARLPDGRPQAAHRHRPRDGATERASSAGRSRTRAALDALAARLEGAGRRGDGRSRGAGRRAARAQADLVSAIRPATGWKRFTAPRSTTRRSCPAASISGFRTGPLGLGHAVLTVENIESDDGVLCRRPRLRTFSDYIKNRFAPTSSIVNARHH